MAIRHWPKDQRPREKLLLKGAGALTDAELLAIFLRTGLPGLSEPAIGSFWRHRATSQSRSKQF